VNCLGSIRRPAESALELDRPWTAVTAAVMLKFFICEVQSVRPLRGTQRAPVAGRCSRLHLAEQMSAATTC
jgi:hypothetical protein